jgi:hypothetical protein
MFLVFQLRVCSAHSIMISVLHVVFSILSELSCLSRAACPPRVGRVCRSRVRTGAREPNFGEIVRRSFCSASGRQMFRFHAFSAGGYRNARVPVHGGVPARYRKIFHFWVAYIIPPLYIMGGGLREKFRFRGVLGGAGAGVQVREFGDTAGCRNKPGTT